MTFTKELLSSGTWDEEQRQKKKPSVYSDLHCTLQSHYKCAIKELQNDTLTVPMLQFEKKEKKSTWTL